MAEEWFSLVPENIRTHSIDLAAIGVDGSAWPTSVAHEVIQALQDNGWAILGATSTNKPRVVDYVALPITGFPILQRLKVGRSSCTEALLKLKPFSGAAGWKVSGSLWLPLINPMRCNLFVAMLANNGIKFARGARPTRKGDAPLLAAYARR
jgi:hypothetical protein